MTKEDKILSECLSDALMYTRDDMHMSQAEVARIAGVDRKTVSWVEQGRSQRMSTFLLLCTAMGVRPSDVMRRAEKMMNDYIRGGNDDEF